ncbi:MAG: hypothetical protein IPP69_17490 [Flavobacteriales bacterium]|nr:hypothetical protein [Flavobacteriales bacterium]
MENKLTNEVQSDISDSKKSGYLSGVKLAQQFTTEETSGEYWIRSGIAGFNPDAASHFFLPERYTDPFENITSLEYDSKYLFIKRTLDAHNNETIINRFDFRVLAPLEITDMNGNASEMVFDILSMPAAMAVKGKGNEGDNLANLAIEIDHADLIQFFTSDPYDETVARNILGNATARYVYYLGETTANDHSPTMNPPVAVAAITREKHIAQLQTNEISALQIAFQYADGSGSVIATKSQAEPETDGGPLRWITNGKTISNNKGKPVKQYEPYFTASHFYADPVEVGVTPIIYYDAAGRLVA